VWDEILFWIYITDPIIPGDVDNECLTLNASNTTLMLTLCHQQFYSICNKFVHVIKESMVRLNAQHVCVFYHDLVLELRFVPVAYLFLVNVQLEKSKQQRFCPVHLDKSKSTWIWFSHKTHPVI